MTSKVIRPPFFELSASEEDYLKDIHFHLDFWEAEAKSALIQLKKNSDWKSLDAQLFVGAYVLFAQKEDVEEEKVNHRAYGMYMALEYVSKVRDCIENKQLIRAIRHSLKISYYFSRGDLFKAEIPKIYGAKGGRKTAVWGQVDIEKWERLYEDLHTRHPDESENYFAKEIVATLQREEDSKPEDERSSVPSVSSVDKKLREMGVIKKARKVASASET